MSVAKQNNFQNILLTLKKYQDNTFELLYISSEIRNILEYGQKFYEDNFFEKYFPTLPEPVYNHLFDRLGSGDKIYCPFFFNKTRFQFVRIEGYIMAQEDNSYLINALISPVREDAEIKFSWILNSEKDFVVSSIQQDTPVFNRADLYDFILSKFDFLDKQELKDFEQDSAKSKFTIFPNHLFLTKSSLNDDYWLIRLEYYRNEIVEKVSQDDLKTSTDNLIYYEYYPKSDTVSWSGDLEAILGYPVGFFENFSGKDWKKLIHPDDRHIYKIHYDHFGKLVYRVLHHDGHYIFVQDEVRQFDHAKKSEKLVLGVISDISELKEIEKDLLNNRTVLDELTGVVPGMVYLMQTFPDHSHKFLFVSDGCRNLMGLEPKDIIQNEHNLHKLVHKDDLATLLESDKLAYEKDEKFESYFRIITPSGQKKWIYAASNRLKKYEKESIWAGFFIDFTYTKHKEIESSLHLSRYKALFEENPLPIIQYEKSGKIIDINRSFIEKLSVADKEMVVSRNFSEILGNQPIEDAYINSINEGYGFYEGPFVNMFNGKLSHLRVNAKEIENGKTYQAILEDISEQEFVHNIISKLTERTSKYSGQQFFDELTLFLAEKLQMSHCIIAEISEDGKTADTLAYIKKGRKEEKITFSLENTPCEEFLKTNQPLVLYNNASSSYSEDKLLGENSIATYIGVPIVDLQNTRLGLLILMDEKPKPYTQGLGGLLTILSDRIGAELSRLNYENRLLKSEQLFRSIAENFPKGTIEVLDHRLIYIYTDGTEYRSKGIDPSKFIGTPHLSKYESYVSNEVRQYLDKVLHGESVMFEVVIEDQYYIKSGVPLVNNFGEIDRILMVTQNITETKLAEEEREKLIRELKSQNEELQRFAYIISHNLRAPIVNISSLLELYDTGYPGNEENVEIMENLSLATSILNSTLQDLIEVVSIKNNKLPKVDLVEFQNLINNIERSLFKQVKETNATIFTDLEEVPNIHYIYSHLENFLTNLTTNALKYKHPDRDPVINIRTYKENEYTVIEFEDNGMGIDLERYGDRMFGLYQRFHSHVDGKGLGLYLVREQIRAHEGNLKVYSEVGEGTKFLIYLKNLKQDQQDLVGEKNN